MELDPETFLLEDYKQKIAYLTNHFQRMWTRFNFFVTIESALIGGKFLMKSEVPTPGLAITGLVLSLVWYVMGTQDRFLVKLYRWQVEQAADRLKKFFTPSAGTDQTTDPLREAAQEAAFQYVGSVEKDRVMNAFVAWDQSQLGAKSRLKRFLEHISSWRAESFSITHLVSFIPLLIAVLWVVMLVVTLISQKQGIPSN